MKNRFNLEEILKNGDMESLRVLLKTKKGVLHRMIRFLYHTDDKIKESAARGFGIASEVLDEEKMKDLMRRFMWMINDESGTNSWDIPRAIGEIGRAKYDLVKDHMPCLLFHAEDPEPVMRESLKDALRRMGKESELSRK